jgi:hypothetical protein
MNLRWMSVVTENQRSCTQEGLTTTCAAETPAFAVETGPHSTVWIGVWRDIANGDAVLAGRGFRVQVATHFRTSP